MSRLRMDLYVLLFVVLLGSMAGIWLAQKQQTSTQELKAAQERWLMNRNFALKIKELQLSSHQQSIHLDNNAEALKARVIRTIESTATNQARIQQRSILSISPGHPQRLGDTGFQRVPITVSMRELTMQQVLTLLHELENGPLNLVSDQVDLSHAQPQTSTTPNTNMPDTWNMRVTLSFRTPVPHEKQ